MALCSFDIVSKVAKQELDNAVQQAKREIENRYDLKQSKTEIEVDSDQITIETEDEFKLNAVLEIFRRRLLARGIDPKAVSFGAVEAASSGRARVKGPVLNGLSKENGKALVKVVKGLGLKKVQAAIQGEQVRLSSKSIDDLQEVIHHLKGADFPVPLQFVNMKS